MGKKINRRILWVGMGIVIFSLSPGQAEPYQGKLQCKTLNALTTYFSRLQVGRLCDEAVRDCDVLENLEKLGPEDPLRQDAEDNLRQRLKGRLEACEIAIKVHEPDYYNSHLRRDPRPPKRTPPADKKEFPKGSLEDGKAEEERPSLENEEGLEETPQKNLSKEEAEKTGAQAIFPEGPKENPTNVGPLGPSGGPKVPEAGNAGKSRIYQS